MQKLHLVGFTANFDGLIFSARKGAKSGSFVVPIDGRLLKQVAEAERRRDGGAAPKAEEHRLNSPRLVRPESALTPREMQDRIRSGWTLDEVAAEAGVDDDWVRRFAAPVLAEVRQVVERARAAVYDKPRFGLSTLPLGASVRRNVLERGVRVAEEELDDAWSAYQLDDDLWIVRFAYTSRGRLQEAEWLFDVESEELTSRNRLGAQLGHVARGRGGRRPAATVSTVPKPPKKPAAKKAAPATKPVAKKAVAKKAVTKKAAPRKAAAKKAAPRKAVAKKVPPKKAVAKQTAAKKVTPRKAAVVKAPTRTPRAARPATRKVAVPAAHPRSTPPRPDAARTRARRAAPNGTAPVRPPTAARTSAAPRSKRASAQPAKKPAKEKAPARAAVEVLPEPVLSTWSPPSPPHQQDWPTDAELPVWTPPEPVGPLPAPPPAPVPESVRAAVASPIGEELEPPLPGATEVDPVSGIARIDSRRTSRYVSGPAARQPVFRGDVARAGPPPEPPGPRRPRRSEPLRGR